MTEGRGTHTDSRVRDSQTQKGETLTETETETDKSDTSMTVCFTESRTGLARGEALIHVKCKALTERDTEREGDREIPDNNMKRETNTERERENDDALVI